MSNIFTRAFEKKPANISESHYRLFRLIRDLTEEFNIKKIDGETDYIVNVGSGNNSDKDGLAPLFATEKVNIHHIEYTNDDTPKDRDNVQSHGGDAVDVIPQIIGIEEKLPAIIFARNVDALYEDNKIEGMPQTTWQDVFNTSYDNLPPSGIFICTTKSSEEALIAAKQLMHAGFYIHSAENPYADRNRGGAFDFCNDQQYIIGFKEPTPDQIQHHDLLSMEGTRDERAAELEKLYETSAQYEADKALRQQCKKEILAMDAKKRRVVLIHIIDTYFPDNATALHEHLDLELPVLFDIKNAEIFERVEKPIYFPAYPRLWYFIGATTGKQKGVNFVENGTGIVIFQHTSKKTSKDTEIAIDQEFRIYLTGDNAKEILEYISTLD